MDPEDDDLIPEDDSQSSEPNSENVDPSEVPDEPIKEVPPLDGSESGPEPVYQMRMTPRMDESDPVSNSSESTIADEEPNQDFEQGSQEPPEPTPPEMDSPDSSQMDQDETVDDPSADLPDLPMDSEDPPPAQIRIGDPREFDDDSASKKVDIKPNEGQRIREVPPLNQQEPTRKEDRANLGPMSFYKRKNIQKGRGDKIPGLERGEDGKYRQVTNLNSGQERDQEGLEQQRQMDMDALDPPSGGPLEVDLNPDIIAEIGVDGASSFKPDGQDSTQTLNNVQSAADAVDTLTTGILDVLARLTLNMKKANDNIRQLMDKLEVEDHRDEF